MGSAVSGGAEDYADITAALSGFNGHVSCTPPGYAARSDVNEDGAITFAEITAVLT